MKRLSRKPLEDVRITEVGRHCLYCGIRMTEEEQRKGWNVGHDRFADDCFPVLNRQYNIPNIVYDHIRDQIAEFGSASLRKAHIACGIKSRFNK
jgi:hypothetical protein